MVHHQWGVDTTPTSVVRDPILHLGALHRGTSLGVVVEEEEGTEGGREKGGAEHMKSSRKLTHVSSAGWEGWGDMLSIERFHCILH